VSARAIVIGDGADALVAAHYLARAGREVILLAGETAHDEEGWVPPRIVRDLGLDRAGFQVARTDPWLTVPLPDGGHLALGHDVAQTAAAIRHVSPRDAERWPAFCTRMARLARLLEVLYAVPAPDPGRRGPGALVGRASLALDFRRLGREGMTDLLRTLPISVADLLDDWFETDALKGALGALAIRHLRHGPRAGGTACALLHQHVGSPPGVFRPAQTNVSKVLAALPGVEIRRGAEVTAIDVRRDRVEGVTLASGERIAAATVVSGIDPRRTLLGLVDAGWLDPEFTRAVRNIRCRGVAARVTLTLDRPPGFDALVVAPSLDYLERASDDAKYGRISQRPYLEARVTERGAAGRRRIAVHVQYAPYALADGAWDAPRRAALGDLVVHTLAEHLPGADAGITERNVLTPHDLEQTAGWPQGQPRHAELTLDQFLWMRPIPQLAGYRTPVPGLYLCGPAMHPGGGVLGAAGANAAREIVRA
jgi:phytoene dehydrogenase-like protein